MADTIPNSNDGDRGEPVRPWRKYIRSDRVDGTENISISESSEDHQRDLLGVPGWTGPSVVEIQKQERQQYYADKDSFFRRFFYGEVRIGDYDTFIRKRVKKSEEILSIGSGRCANELMLMEDGYDLVCSDLESPYFIQAALELFPEISGISS